MWTLPNKTHVYSSQNNNNNNNNNKNKIQSCQDAIFFLSKQKCAMFVRVQM